MAAASCGQSVAPIFLRLALAVVFIWAGMDKLIAKMPVQGQTAARLANMGVLKPRSPDAPAPSAPAGDTPDSTRPAPSEPLPEGSPPALMNIQQSGGAEARYTAADFPDPVDVPRLYGISILLYDAAFPVTDVAEGKQKMPLWPAAAAKDRWPVWLAWAVAITEVGGGILMLIGLFTRFTALLLMGTMVGAIWLTEVGPAIQSGETMLGFLPKRDLFDGRAWSTLWMQFVLLMVSSAVLFTGGGALSLDKGLFTKEPPPAKPKPKPDA